MVGHILCYFRFMIPRRIFNGWGGGAERSAQGQTSGNEEGIHGNTGLVPTATLGADIEMSNSGDQAVLEDLETQAEDRSCSYIFLRTPKKLGEKLLSDDVNPPEGWGMHIEEGLKVGRLFMLILLLYLSGTLVFGIFWYREFGMAGPQSGFGAFGVSSWMVSLISIITTVWFKWSD